MRLGLSKKEFFALTLRALDAFMERERDRDREQRQRQEILFAQLTAAVINFSFRAPKEPVKPEKLMPSRWNSEERASGKRMTKKRREHVAESLRAVMAAFMKEK